jgi:hypothetical protein
MMDRDPERLVKGAENGSARELLLAARAEEAPRAVRESVLSTLAAAFARARANAGGVPASKLSGIFERLEETSSKPTLASRSPLLERRTLEQHVMGPLDAAPIELRRRSRRIARAQIVRRTPIALQLGAAVLVGVLGATGVHFASSMASRALPSYVERAAASLRATISTQTNSTQTNASPHRNLSSAGNVSPVAETLPGAGAAQLRAPVGIAPPRAIAALESPADALSTNELSTNELSTNELSTNELSAIEGRHTPLRGIAVPAAESASVRPGRSCAGCSPADATAAARTTARAAFDELADDRGPFSEDWLGEQLALVSRAQRSLAEGNPADARRSLDEYQARFPKGLLDLEIAALRDKAERHLSPVNASEMPRSN